MRHTDPLFVALTKRETLGDGMFPYQLSVVVTLTAVIAILVLRQWLVTSVLYVCLMTLMAVLQTRDKDIFSILALRARLWGHSWSRNGLYWRARSYQP